MDDRIAAEQRRRNAMTRGDWTGFADHRYVVTEQLTRGRDAPRGRLCVLGAGNVNDLDLRRLLSAYGEIHLVDIDRDAVSAGVARQGCDGDARLAIHAPCDVTGILAALQCDSSGAQADERIGETLLAAVHAGPQIKITSLGQFDTVASTCLLTQLIDSVAIALGGLHPRLLDVVQAIRLRHARLMVDLLAPGGLGVLFTDVVSSDTAPELANVAAEDFAVAVAVCVARGNFFTGTNPAVLRALFLDDPLIAPSVAKALLVRPWPWRLGPRTLAVCAVKFLTRK